MGAPVSALCKSTAAMQCQHLWCDHSMIAVHITLAAQTCLDLHWQRQRQAECAICGVYRQLLLSLAGPWVQPIGIFVALTVQASLAGSMGPHSLWLPGDLPLKCLITVVVVLHSFYKYWAAPALYQRAQGLPPPIRSSQAGEQQEP